MKERLEIDEEWMFTTCNDVVSVEIGRVEDVKESQVRSLSLIETPYLLLAPALPRVNVLRPAGRAPIEDSHRAERRLNPTRVQPPQQLLEVQIDSKGLGLVHHPNSGAEFQNGNGSASTMRVGEPSSCADE